MNESYIIYVVFISVVRGHGNEIFFLLNGFWPLRSWPPTPIPKDGHKVLLLIDVCKGGEESDNEDNVEGVDRVQCDECDGFISL